jgi:hypothetical protein
MKILVIGAKGSTGKRYCAILKCLGHKVIQADIEDLVYAIPNYCIIATPTNTHASILKNLVVGGAKNVLIEKPAFDNFSEIEVAKKYKIDIRQVCNWQYIADMKAPGQNTIIYDYYNPGPDKYSNRENLAQLIYLAGEFKCKLTSPVFNVSVNGSIISHRQIEMSFVKMIERWIAYPTELWGLDDVEKMLTKIEQK